jgi:hypothetical protein
MRVILVAVVPRVGKLQIDVERPFDERFALRGDVAQDAINVLIALPVSGMIPNGSSCFMF